MTTVDDKIKEALPVEPVGKLKRFVLLAENQAHARNCAREWGWTEEPAGIWRDHHGVEVDFICDEADLEAAVSNSDLAVYCGYRWYAAIRPHVLTTFEKAAALRVLIEPQKVR